MSQWADCPIRVASLVFFDLETTGLRPDRGAHIREIAVLNRDGLELNWTLESDLRGTDRADDAVAAQLPTLVSLLQTGVVVGHNLSFDFRFVTYEAERLGTTHLQVRFIDTLGLARRLVADVPNYELATLLAHFNAAPAKELHTAVGDVRATRTLFWHLVDHGALDTLADAGLQPLTWTGA